MLIFLSVVEMVLIIMITFTFLLILQEIGYRIDLKVHAKKMSDRNFAKKNKIDETLTLLIK
jgi:hypothetical protein